MATIILEHRFAAGRFRLERYEAVRQRSAACRELHGVRHVVSYVTPDGERMVCVFEAPDTEAVRRAARQLGYAYDSVWAATVVRDADGARPGQ